MLTDNPLTEVSLRSRPTGATGGPGERIRRLRRRRRLFREEMLAVLVLFLFLAATVTILATQWLDSAPAGNAIGRGPNGGSSIPIHPVPDGGTVT